MDFVYVVRRSEENEALRYSLRSIEQHTPVGRVWVVGYKPKWIHGVGYLPTNQSRSKWENSTANLLTACLHDEVAESFVYMNDDFYVVEPVDDIEPLHRGPVADVLDQYTYTRGHYVAGMRETARLLASLGVKRPLSYELHVPMLIERAAMVEAMHAATDRKYVFPMTALHKRTLYGNLRGVGGRQVPDVKANAETSTLPPGPYWSSSSAALRGRMGRELRRRFPTPCSFERR